MNDAPPPACGRQTIGRPSLEPVENFLRLVATITVSVCSATRAESLHWGCGIPNASSKAVDGARKLSSFGAVVSSDRCNVSLCLEVLVVHSSYPQGARSAAEVVGPAAVHGVARPGGALTAGRHRGGRQQVCCTDLEERHDGAQEGWHGQGRAAAGTTRRPSDLAPVPLGGGTGPDRRHGQQG